jgi:hypothetical protein
MKLMWNIDEKSVEEVLRVLARMGRLYFILSLFSLLAIYMAVEDNDLFEVVYECGILILFVAYVYVLRTVTAGVPLESNSDPLINMSNGDLNHTTRIPKLKAAGCIVILISVAYTIKMIYTFLDDAVYLDLALSFVSIVVQLSTLYVLFKLIDKITFAEEGRRNNLRRELLSGDKNSFV